MKSLWSHDRAANAAVTAITFAALSACTEPTATVAPEASTPQASAVPTPSPTPNTPPSAHRAHFALLSASPPHPSTTSAQADSGPPQQPAACSASPPTQPPVTISSQLPADVCIPAGFPGVPFPFFDDFSWRSFVALVWPALEGQRGTPDTAQSIGAPGKPLVFETFKFDWEVFQPQGAAPTDFQQMTGMNPCGADLQFGDVVLASFSKFGNLGQAGFGNLVGPLVTQSKTYTRFLASFNAVEFETILAKKLYLQANLSNVTFAPDAQNNTPIDTKSSWIEMTGVAHPERYYTRPAWVMDPGTGTCAETKVGLVGLHIVTKTSGRPQWVWSTFEQVDNVPGTDATSPFAYNDGTATAMPTSNPVGFPPPATPPAPFNVTRLLATSPSTETTNASYQKELAKKGTGVWQFYRLVMTQWPVQAATPQNPGTPAFTFPGTGATTPFSNVTMETFDQASVSQGCMNCHNITKSGTDFNWTLAINAFPPLTGTNASQPQFQDLGLTHASVPALKKLKALMTNH
jgi:hypothetical protein